MLFDLKNISCGYDGITRVLEIEQLSVPSGALVFIIGASGVGKSTFLETLGLMNNTIFPKSDSVFDFYPLKGSKVSLADVWEKSNDYISLIRNDYFSFIFQQTNLMPHFTVEENMVISQLINGSNYQESRERVREIMKAIFLEDEILDRKITELSGGQRQRLAFVRAFTASFDVLLGDEPTGNLDPVTARSLMKTLKEYLKEKGKTGLVVSHDINLAVQFSDIIIPIEYRATEEANNASYGYIHDDLVLTKKEKNWSNKFGEVSSTDIYKTLETYLSSSMNSHKDRREIKDKTK